MVCISEQLLAVCHLSCKSIKTAQLFQMRNEKKYVQFLQLKLRTSLLTEKIKIAFINKPGKHKHDEESLLTYVYLWK